MKGIINILFISLTAAVPIALAWSRPSSVMAQKILPFLCFSCAEILLPLPSYASPNVITGTVKLVDSTTALKTPTAAIYFTVRPDSGGVLLSKKPPIITKRIDSGDGFDFPLSFSLTRELDSTLEGKDLASDWENGKVPLIISCRYDVDGVASTRSSDDLVGQSPVKFIADTESWQEVVINLQGRGAFGKLITQK